MRRLDDPRARSFRALEVLVDALDGDEYVLLHFAGARRPVFGALAADHERAVADDELRVRHDAAAAGAQPLGETERVFQPVDGPGDVGVNQNRNDCRGWRRLIHDHVCLLEGILHVASRTGL